LESCLCHLSGRKKEKKNGGSKIMQLSQGEHDFKESIFIDQQISHGGQQLSQPLLLTVD
jgi:hypothetical protein